MHAHAMFVPARAAMTAAPSRPPQHASRGGSDCDSKGLGATGSGRHEKGAAGVSRRGGLSCAPVRWGAAPSARGAVQGERTVRPPRATASSETEGLGGSNTDIIIPDTLPVLQGEVPPPPTTPMISLTAHTMFLCLFLRPTIFRSIFVEFLDRHFNGNEEIDALFLCFETHCLKGRSFRAWTAFFQTMNTFALK